MFFFIILVVVIVLVALFNFMSTKEDDSATYILQKLSINLPFPIQRKNKINMTKKFLQTHLI